MPRSPQKRISNDLRTMALDEKLTRKLIELVVPVLPTENVRDWIRRLIDERFGELIENDRSFQGRLVNIINRQIEEALRFR